MLDRISKDLGAEYALLNPEQFKERLVPEKRQQFEQQLSEELVRLRRAMDEPPSERDLIMRMVASRFG